MTQLGKVTNPMHVRAKNIPCRAFKALFPKRFGIPMPVTSCSFLRSCEQPISQLRSSLFIRLLLLLKLNTSDNRLRLFCPRVTTQGPKRIPVGKYYWRQEICVASAWSGRNENSSHAVAELRVN